LQKGEPMSHPALNEIVASLIDMEEKFHETNDENLEMFAASIVNHRLFLYDMEKRMMNPSHPDRKEQSDMSMFYNYLNAYVENTKTNFRDLVLFEIDQLIAGKNCSREKVEHYFILEKCSMTVSIFMAMYHKETGVEINPYDIRVIDIENILMDLGINRKTALKFCVAGIAECFDKGDSTLIESIVGNKTEKFYKFYDTTIANHNIYDGEAFLLLLFIATFTYICESFLGKSA
jgi:hypothetical protein